MKIFHAASIFCLVAVVWADTPAQDGSNSVATKADADEKKDEGPKVKQSNITANWNPDRTEAWGDVELVGGGQGWEYVKGMFGSPVLCRPKKLVLAEPELGCSDITNDIAGGIALISRGNCSFADKAAYAQTAGAKGVIIMNSGEDLIRMPAGWINFPEEILINIPIVMIRGTSGIALKKILYRDEVYAQIVAKHWTPEGEYQTGHCAESVLLEEEEDAEVGADGEVEVNNLELGEEGGQIQLLDNPVGASPGTFEYLTAKFGGPRPVSSRELVWADPQDACKPLKNNYLGKFVLAKRGGCPFTQKAENIELAGGFGAVVINNAPVLVQMAKGDVPDYKVTIPTVMVTSKAGEYLEAAINLNEQTKISFKKFDVQARFWDGLKDLKSPQKWPADHDEREKLYERLKNIHAPTKSEVGGRERFEYLTSLYDQATQYWGASV